MDMKDSKLFSPLKVGSLTLRNRVGMAPMSMDYEAKDGTVPKRLADIFVRRAEGGTGYVMIDAVTIDRKYQYIGKTTCLDSDDLVPQFASSPSASPPPAAPSCPRLSTPARRASAASAASRPWARASTPTPTVTSPAR